MARSAGKKQASTSAASVDSASSTSSVSTSSSSDVRKRNAISHGNVARATRGQEGAETGDGDAPLSWTDRNRWVVFALASGACAAFNGVFAKLTTNDLTTHIASALSGLLGLQDEEKAIEVIVRGGFFGLNLVFNGVMWTLFTQALAKGQSTTQVSIMNTSANFVITALLGLAIFSESLPPLWWLGATLLVAGNVIIGRKEEGDKHADSDWGRDNEAQRAPGTSHQSGEETALLGER